jgi:hypothetical protein
MRKRFARGRQAEVWRDEHGRIGQKVTLGDAIPLTLVRNDSCLSQHNMASVICESFEEFWQVR